MSPKLADQEPEVGIEKKYVRDGEEVAWGNTRRDHADIGLEEGVGSALVVNALSMERLEGDDAGYLELTRGGHYEVGSNSATCRRRNKWRGRGGEARQETLDVITRITGKEARAV